MPEQSRTETHGNWGFVVRVARVYTKAVFEIFERTMKVAISYKVVHDDDGGPHDWLVQHSNTTSQIVWGQHQFKVHVDQDSGQFTCEFKTWEHTDWYIQKIHEHVYLGADLQGYSVHTFAECSCRSTSIAY